jgi:hypothetical protein
MLGTLITIRDGFQGNLRNWTNSSNDLRRLSYTPAVVARTGLLGHYPHRAKFSYLCGAFEGVPPTLQLLGAAPGQTRLSEAVSFRPLTTQVRTSNL